MTTNDIRNLLAEYYITYMDTVKSRDGDIEEEYRMKCVDGSSFCFLLTHSGTAESMATDFIEYAREIYKVDEKDPRGREIKRRLSHAASEIEIALGWKPRVIGMYYDRHPQNW